MIAVNNGTIATNYTPWPDLERFSVRDKEEEICTKIPLQFQCKYNFEKFQCKYTQNFHASYDVFKDIRDTYTAVYKETYSYLFYEISVL